MSQTCHQAFFPNSLLSVCLPSPTFQVLLCSPKYSKWRVIHITMFCAISWATPSNPYVHPDLAQRRSVATGSGRVGTGEGKSWHGLSAKVPWVAGTTSQPALSLYWWKTRLNEVTQMPHTWDIINWNPRVWNNRALFLITMLNYTCPLYPRPSGMQTCCFSFVRACFSWHPVSSHDVNHFVMIILTFHSGDTLDSTRPTDLLTVAHGSWAEILIFQPRASPKRTSRPTRHPPTS